MFLIILVLDLTRKIRLLDKKFMKQLKKSLLLLFVGCSFLGTAQDPEFTQFYANPIYLNPAMAGTHGCPRVNMNYRNQWSNITGAFVTHTVSYDQYVNSIHGGLSIQLMNDAAGQNVINWNALNLAYSYHLNLTKKYTLLFGVQAGWNQKFLNWSELTFGDMIDPRKGFIYQTGDVKSGREVGNNWTTKGFFDVGAGLVVFSKSFYAGFSTKHLNRPNESLILSANGSRLPMRFTGHMGAKIPLGGNSKYGSTVSLSPNVIYTYQDEFNQLNLGLYAQYSLLTFGTWLRPRDAFIMSLGIDTGNLRFGYSYDVTISSLSNASGGSHELSLAKKFNCRKTIRSFRTISCPSF